MDNILRVSKFGYKFPTYHATVSIFINMLETKDPMSLKVSLDRIYKILVKSRYKVNSCEDRLISEWLTSAKDFHNKMMQNVELMNF